METAISINDVSMRYGELQVLNNISLNIAKGSFFGLLGANGAGKSTLLNIINTILRPDAGQVKIMGYDILTQANQAKRELGVVPQEFNMSSFDSVKNVLVTQAGFFGISAKNASSYCDELLKRLVLWDKRDSQVLRLSGGMKRRLMIARALVNKPKVLLLDEPTAGVDVEIRRSMWEFIKEINAQGTTIILTTHYLEEAESLCDTIGIIDKGEIIKTGSKKELLKSLNTQTLMLDLVSSIDNLDVIKINNKFKLELKDANCLEVTCPIETTINDLMQELSACNITVSNIQHSKNRLEKLLIA